MEKDKDENEAQNGDTTTANATQEVGISARILSDMNLSEVEM